MKGLVVVNKSVSLQDRLAMPTLGKQEVLVKIIYASINSFDLETIAGKNDGLGILLGAKKYPVRTGLEFSGIVQSDGAKFKKGDQVFGYPHLIKGQKTHQEYIAINEAYISHKPANLDFAESAAIPLGALTSLVALEDLGNINKDSKVLINGAAGGLGVYAVQIAHLFGADITAIAGPGQEAFLKELGAQTVLNYRSQAIREIDGQYDIIFELTTKVKFPTIKHLLAPRGVFIPANPFSELLSLFGNPFRKKKVRYLMVDKGDEERLSRIATWAEQGKLRPIIDQTYSFQQYQQAFKRTQEAGKRGRIVMQIEESDLGK